MARPSAGTVPLVDSIRLGSSSGPAPQRGHNDPRGVIPTADSGAPRPRSPALPPVLAPVAVRRRRLQRPSLKGAFARCAPRGPGERGGWAPRATRPAGTRPSAFRARRPFPAGGGDPAKASTPQSRPRPPRVPALTKSHIYVRFALSPLLNLRPWLQSQRHVSRGQAASWAPSAIPASLRAASLSQP